VSLFDRTLVALLPMIPKSVVGRIARRYVAGDSLEKAMSVVERIEGIGACSTFDFLGEEISSIEEAESVRDAYLDALDAIKARDLDANVSIKLSAFGMRLDPGICHVNVNSVLDRARRHGNFIRIDMEDSSLTSDTIGLYRRLREEGHENVGLVFQACMRRAMDDLQALEGLAVPFRLCKGIYVEPEDIAYQDPGEINRNYLALLERMFEQKCRVGIATHDRELVEGAQDLIERHGVGPEQYEFQMLLGVQKPLGRELLNRGYKLRIYVPYGADWYAYCMRRMKENPRIVRYVFSALFRRS